MGIVRTDDSDTAFRAAVAGVEGGLQTIQVSMTAPDALDIARGVAASTGARVGIGSVTDPKSVILAKKARIPFIATPFLHPEVVVGLTTGVFPNDALRRGDFAAVRELAARATAMLPRPVWG